MKLFTKSGNFKHFSKFFGNFVRISRVTAIFCNCWGKNDKISSKFCRKMTKFIEFCKDENENENKSFIFAKKSGDFFLKF